MRRSWLAYALVVSVLVNVGVVAAAAYARLGGAAPVDLASHLQLDAQQRRAWHELEEPFVRELDAGWGEIAGHRERLIREVFSAQPDPARIEAERSRIAALQSAQQQRVIEQFLRERAILTPAQRASLVELLLRERPALPQEQQLHGR